MRPVNLADIEVAARVLMAVEEDDRPKTMADIIARADVADRWRRKLHRPHPVYGTGTLMSAAQAYSKAPRPLCIARDELYAYAVVIEALVARRTHQIS